MSSKASTPTHRTVSWWWLQTLPRMTQTASMMSPFSAHATSCSLWVQMRSQVSSLVQPLHNLADSACSNNRYTFSCSEYHNFLLFIIIIIIIIAAPFPHTGFPAGTAAGITFSLTFVFTAATTACIVIVIVFLVLRKTRYSKNSSSTDRSVTGSNTRTTAIEMDTNTSYSPPPKSSSPLEEPKRSQPYVKRPPPPNPAAPARPTPPSRPSHNPSPHANSRPPARPTPPSRPSHNPPPHPNSRSPAYNGY